MTDGPAAAVGGGSRGTRAGAVRVARLTDLRTTSRTLR